MPTPADYDSLKTALFAARAEADRTASPTRIDATARISAQRAQPTRMLQTIAEQVRSASTKVSVSIVCDGAGRATMRVRPISLSEKWRDTLHAADPRIPTQHSLGRVLVATDYDAWRNR